MTKIEQILNKVKEDAQIVGIDFTVIIYNDAVEAMKEYAEHYAKKCLEKAAEQAVVFLPSHYGLHGTHNVDKDSILNIKLPEHD